VAEDQYSSAGKRVRTRVGENVGSEINGKRDLFSRPVVIYEKLSHGFYFVVATTTAAGSSPLGSRRRRWWRAWTRGGGSTSSGCRRSSGRRGFRARQEWVQSAVSIKRFLAVAGEAAEKIMNVVLVYSRFINLK